MDTLIEVLLIGLVGVVATLFTDLWSIARRALLGVALPDYGLVGRWIAHMRHGRFHHQAIAKAPPVQGERILGWTAHYMIGIVFAALLVAATGPDWLQTPVLLPALAVGMATVAAPFFVMQPGMGAGIAASRTPRPSTARLQSLLTHAMFGIGLYIGGRLIEYGRTLTL